MTCPTCGKPATTTLDSDPPFHSCDAGHGWQDPDEVAAFKERHRAAVRSERSSMYHTPEKPGILYIRDGMISGDKWTAQATSRFRWAVRGHADAPELLLQQAWQNMGTGELLWRTVPRVVVPVEEFDAATKEPTS